MKEIKRLIRCENGHFYDSGKFSECPHCNNTRLPNVTVFAGDKYNTEDDSPAETNRSTGYTELVYEEKDSAAALDATAEKPAENLTVHYFQKAIGTEPVVGWLVCIKGVHFGEDFKIKSGRNFIGRSGGMNISLSGDTAVSRDKHAILTYDPKSNSFMIQPGDSSELCYLNDEIVLVPSKLKVNDRISLGESELMFVPFCSDDFSWDK